MMSKDSSILSEVLTERDSELKTRKIEAKIRRQELMEKETEKKRILRERLISLNEAIKAAQQNISELTQDQKVKSFILNSLLQNCEEETIGGKTAFGLIRTDGLALTHVYPNAGFNDVYLFLNEYLNLFVAYLRHMSHDYGYSSRSDERLCLDLPKDSPKESKVLEHIEYHLHHIWRDKLIPGVLRALSDKKSAIEFFAKTLPDQKDWWEEGEHHCFAKPTDHIKRVWRGQPLLKIC